MLVDTMYNHRAGIKSFQAVEALEPMQGGAVIVSQVESLSVVQLGSTRFSKQQTYHFVSCEFCGVLFWF